MANSQRFNSLKSRIDFLETNILPPIKVNGNYTKKESDFIRSYVILAHAEIEAYFEDIASTKVKKALNDWRINRKKSNCLLAIMSFCAEEINWENIKCEQKEKFDFRVNKTVTHYINKLNSNHGVKAKNLFNILLPIGVEVSEIDDIWLSTMDNFGATRGVFAHSTISTQTQIDLVTERNNLRNNIIPEISNLDKIVKKIK